MEIDNLPLYIIMHPGLFQVVSIFNQNLIT